MIDVDDDSGVVMVMMMAMMMMMMMMMRLPLPGGRTRQLLGGLFFVHDDGDQNDD